MMRPGDPTAGPLVLKLPRRNWSVRLRIAGKKAPLLKDCLYRVWAASRAFSRQPILYPRPELKTGFDVSGNCIGLGNQRLLS